MSVFDFEVRRSRIQGRGLFARSPVPARRKLGELSGEIITQREARRRARASYTVKMVEFGDGTALDASVGGNHFAFVNHSCAPNTYMRLFRHRVEFYSLRPIAPGEELTCNYGETHHEGTLACRCGSVRCRGYL
ncbi:MAG TPA: SET domain-containing protein-lysine N-methyltransferase [Pyrinomonadaceae bacterium]|nr:SET domain-containing protein-lysine N-methyltransferase [Pyrinomonadaceae bacterium]